MPLDADDLKLDDVGIDSDAPCFKHARPRGPPPVTYLHFYDCPKFSVIYLLPFCVSRFVVLKRKMYVNLP